MSGLVLAFVSALASPQEPVGPVKCQALEQARLLEQLPEPLELAELLRLGQGLLDVGDVVEVPELDPQLVSDFTEANARGDLVRVAELLGERARRCDSSEAAPGRCERWRRLARELERAALLPDSRRSPAEEALRHRAVVNEYLDEGRASEAAERAALEVELLERAGLCHTETLVDALDPILQHAVGRGRWGEVDEIVRRSLNVQLALDPDGPEAANLLRVWAQSLYYRGERPVGVEVGHVALSYTLEHADGPTTALVSAFSDAGLSSLGVNDNASALALAEMTLSLARQVYGVAHLSFARSAVLLAEVHTRSGYLSRASALLTEAIRVQREHGSAGLRDLQGTLQNQAILYWHAGREEDALRMLRESVALARALFGDEHPRYAYALRASAQLVRSGGEEAVARDLAERAAAVFDVCGMTAFAHEMRGLALDLLDGPLRIAALTEHILELEDAGAAPEARAEVLRQLSAAHFEQRDFAESYDLAVAAAELVRGVGVGQSALAQLRGRRAEASLGVERNDEAAEVFGQLLESQERQFARTPGSLATGARLSDVLQLRPIAAVHALALARADRLVEAAAVIERVAERPLAELLDESASFSPRAPAEILDELEDGEVLITTIWSETAIVVLWWSDEGVQLSFTAWLRDEVEALERELVAIVHGLRSGGGVDARARAFGSTLFSDELRRAAATASRIAWVPSGPLNALPLDVLLGSERSWSVARAPSATVLATRRERARASNSQAFTAILVGDPRVGTSTSDDFVASLRGARPALPGARAEVRAIADVIRSAAGTAEILLDDVASVDRVAKLVDQSPPRFLHFAAHGEPGSARSPNDAALVLAEDGQGGGGLLSLAELLANWEGRLAGTELAVLSACDTQAGASVGDSWMALSWGFLVAGAPSVVATLWKVDDRATRLLMQRFYENLLGSTSTSRRVGSLDWQAGEALPKSDALAEAKAWLRGATFDEVESAATRGSAEATGAAVAEVDTSGLVPYAAPRYWAGFVLIGSPD